MSASLIVLATADLPLSARRSTLSRGANIVAGIDGSSLSLDGEPPA